MDVRGVSHIAIGVRDMDRQLGFYRDVLGMRVDADGIDEFPGRDGSAPLRRRAVFLRWHDDDHAGFLVLDQQLASEPVGEPVGLFQVGVHHVGFWVDDLDTIRTRAEQAGFEVLGRPSDADSGSYGEAPGRKIRTVFLRDPEGGTVQLDQRLD